MTQIFINGKEISVPENSSVLDAINISGTPIAQLCKDPDMKASGLVGEQTLVTYEGNRRLPYLSSGDRWNSWLPRFLLYSCL